GAFVGCDADFCLEGLEGYTVTGCGSGARVARGIIERVDGEADITLINYHGSSGFTPDDIGCRVQQTEQVFVAFGDTGAPGANGTHNLVMGDFNTDPERLDEDSAFRWYDFVGP